MKKEIYFRNTFAVRMRSGKRKRRLNQRTLKLLSDKIPVCIIDSNYIEFLLKKKSEHKQSKYYNNLTETTISEYCFNLLEAISALLFPKGFIIVGNDTNITKFFWQKHGFNYINDSIYNFLFSIKSSHTLTESSVLFTNSLSCWVLSNTYAEISFLAIDTNDRLSLYNDKTGLDFFSKLIQTNKIVNKLGLDSLKYLNLQYLFIIILYISFINQLKGEQFFFDTDYFKLIPKYKDKTFSRSLGIGYTLVSEAHQFLSYPFLTKPEFMDYFLLGDYLEYTTQLNRLVKLINNDILILQAFKKYYDTNYSPTYKKYIKNQLQCLIPSEISEGSIRLKLLSRFYSSSNTPIISRLEQKQYLRLLSSYNSKYAKKIPENTSKQEEETVDNTITEYVSNLLKGLI